MSAQDKLDRRAAKHGLGSDERKRKIQKAKDFFSKPVPTYSKDELRKMGHPVEGKFDIVIPEPKGSNKNSDKQRDAKAARRLTNREKTKKHMAKIDKARQKDAAHSATGKMTKSNDPTRKKYQSGAAGQYFSKYESTAEYGKSMDRIKDKEKNAAIKPKDRETLGKLADLMKKQKRNEAYRKPTQAEIDADKRKDGKSKDSSTRYRDVKKKMYGNAMGGLKKEESQKKIDEAKTHRFVFDTSSKASKAEKSAKRFNLKTDSESQGGYHYVVVTGDHKDVSKWLKMSESSSQEFTAVPVNTAGDVSGGDRMSIAKLDTIMKKRSKDKRQKESVELDENKVFFVKVGDGRDSMTVKTKAKNSREALKKMRAEHPKDRVSLDTNQKQGKSAGTFESSLPAHLQGIIGKDGNIDAKKVKKDPVLNKNKTKVTDVTPKGYGPKEEEVDESTMRDRQVVRAMRIAKDMAGNHTGATKAIEKLKKGLSDHPKVRGALRTANESVSSADKKPQNFRDPETGKLKVRMVPVDRDVVRGDDKARTVRKKRFKHMRKEQMATGNSHVGKDGRDAFMKAFKDVQKTAAEIQKKKDADKK